MGIHTQESQRKMVTKKASNHLSNEINEILTQSKILSRKGLPGGFFSQHNVNVYRALFSEIPDGGNFIECGSFLGRSIMSVRDIILEKKLNGYIIDLWEDKINFLHFVTNTFDIKDNIKILNEDVLLSSRLFEDNSIDFVFLDDFHNYDHLKLEIPLYLKKIKKGGVLAGHDYNDVWHEVKKAVDELLPESNNRGSIWIYKNL